MIEPILKEITEEEYNPNNDDHIKKGCYNEGHGMLYQIDNPPDYYKYYKIIGDTISAPTHQETNRWLLKKHNIFICVLFMEDSGGFGYTIEDVVNKKCIATSGTSIYKEPEEAEDVAIKHCLEKLIYL